MTAKPEKPETRASLWAGEFGNDYHARNPLMSASIAQRGVWLRSVISSYITSIGSVLEPGCGMGANLASFHEFNSRMKLSGIEANAEAAAAATRYAFITPGDAATVPMGTDAFDLVLTCGFLIHVPPAALAPLMRKLFDASSRFILSAEYFSRDCEEAPYQGMDGALWRRPYGDLWMDACPAGQLKPLSSGFAWKRTTGLDDLTWHLFEKVKP